MPVDKYKAFYEIVKMLMRMDLTKLRSIQKELSVLSKVRKSSKSKRKSSKKVAATRTKKSKSKRKSSNKRPSPAQLRARKQFAMRVKRGDFR